MLVRTRRSTMPREMRCGRCGDVFLANRLTDLLPRRWRLCPRCRGPLPPSGAVPVRDGGRPGSTPSEAVP